ncbi:hypothetical protein MP228_011965 [Amoeboaphelidium protococcarum]|nr:hypothetical protein MP228_011965 [Amoeboaphelidium protococcarum]
MLKLQSHLRACEQCCKAYRYIVNHLEDAKFNMVLKYDIDRVSDVLKGDQDNYSVSLRDNIRISLAFYEVLHQPFLLMDNGIAREISQRLGALLKATQKLFVPVVNGVVPVSFLWLIVHKDQTLRFWSAQVLQYLQRKSIQDIRFDLGKDARIIVKVWSYLLDQAFVQVDSSTVSSQINDAQYCTDVSRMLDNAFADRLLLITLKTLRRLISDKSHGIGKVVQLICNYMQTYLDMKRVVGVKCLDYMQQSIIPLHFDGCSSLAAKLTQVLDYESSMRRTSNSISQKPIQQASNMQQSTLPFKSVAGPSVAKTLQQQQFSAIQQRPLAVIQPPKTSSQRSAAFQAIKQQVKNDPIKMPLKRPQQEMLGDTQGGDSQGKRLTIESLGSVTANSSTGNRQVKLLSGFTPKKPATLIQLPGASNQVRRAKTVELFVNALLEWSVQKLQTNLQLFRKPLSVFSSTDAYVNHFEPLFIMEAKAQLLGQLQEFQASQLLQYKLVNAVAVDSNHELVFEIKSSDYQLMENDLLLLCNDEMSNLKSQDSVWSYLEQCRSFTFGKVIVIKRTSQVSTMSVLVRNTSGRLLHKSLNLNKLWTVGRLGSIGSLVRELSALYSVGNIRLVNHILNPQLKNDNVNDRVRIDRVADKYGLNPSQAEAVVSSLTMAQGFKLIQGPAGNGKSLTIIAFLSEFFTQQSRLAYEDGRRVLLCAPSNAAVDELVRRLRNGVKCSDDRRIKLNVVRLGTMEGVHESVKDVTLESLVEIKIAEEEDQDESAAQDTSADAKQQLSNLRSTLKQVKDELDGLYLQQYQAKSAKEADDIGSKISERYDRKQKVIEQITQLKSRRDNDRKLMESLQLKYRKQIMNQAQVICTTLGFSGHDSFNLIDGGFNYLIVDEACQAIELSTLIPLKYQVNKCILVGDPKQLPPTIISEDAKKYGYDQSLFSRMQIACPQSVHLLNVQYRMHPAISKFPIQMFYDGLLQDGPDMLRLSTRKWHADQSFPPYQFYDVGKSAEEKSGTSLVNKAEANAIMAKFIQLCSSFPDIGFSGLIGIITPYKMQKVYLQNMFRRKFGAEILNAVNINTVDGFQGQEKDVILFSCVRANSRQAVGFLADERRLNVGLTRAKSSLWIFGHVNSLQSDSCWRSLIEDARHRGCFSSVKAPYFGTRKSQLTRCDNALRIDGEQNAS